MVQIATKGNVMFNLYVSIVARLHIYDMIFFFRQMFSITFFLLMNDHEIMSILFHLIDEEKDLKDLMDGVRDTRLCNSCVAAIIQEATSILMIFMRDMVEFSHCHI